MTHQLNDDDWTDDQRLYDEDRRLLIRGIISGLIITALGIGVIVLLAKLGDIVFGWTG